MTFFLLHNIKESVILEYLESEKECEIEWGQKDRIIKFSKNSAFHLAHTFFLAHTDHKMGEDKCHRVLLGRDAGEHGGYVCVGALFSLSADSFIKHKEMKYLYY